MSSPDYINNISRYLLTEFELSQDQIDEMLPLFVETIHSHMEKLEETLEANDYIAMKKMGHTMKGALLNLGVTELADLALQIESYSAGETDIVDCEDIVKSLKVKINDIQLN